MGYENIIVEHHDRVAMVKLNAPEVLNALSTDMVSELSSAIRDVTKSDARCLLLTGEGRAFCAGANLSAGPGDGKAPPGHVLETHYHPVMQQLRKMEIPMVTAINGPAVGVGMSFAMMGDIVCASEDAYFLQAFARIGLIPDGGATYLLPRLVGWGRAMELSLLAERLPAATAQEWGLVNRVFADTEALAAGSMELAQRLANGPRSLALIRKAYWQSWGNSYEQQLELEAQLQNEAGRSSDFREGVSAFLQKRDAAFKGE